MLPQEIIRRKRDGLTLQPQELQVLVSGIVSGAVSEGQIGAFCMAVLWRGMTIAERTALMLAMAHSGKVLQWELPGPVLDKHSTGGVGDKTSLALAPIIAACGGYVPMISGRGLGHTGGTLDKFESIPGYQVQPELAMFKRCVREVGCAVIGQTGDLAPADGRIYAVRDVTATVESIDLITASILSKKLAAGLQALVMDVKIGSGAFIPDLASARALADSLAQVGCAAGLPVTALLTDMNEVLGHSAGNALEVHEVIDWLRGGTPDLRLAEVTYALCAQMLVQGGLAESVDAARLRCEQVVGSGKAAEKLAQMVSFLGGPADLLERPAAYLPTAPVIRPVVPARAGFVQRMDVRAIGLIIVALGGGRTRPQDGINPAVGLSAVVGLGAAVGPQQPLALVHASSEQQAQSAAAALLQAVTLGDAPVSPNSLVLSA